MADWVGQQIVHYRLLRLLGRGGFAEVYLGEQVHLGTQAAVKLLHPHIVRVLDFGIEADLPYLVLDYAPGGACASTIPLARVSRSRRSWPMSSSPVWPCSTHTTRR